MIRLIIHNSATEKTMKQIQGPAANGLIPYLSYERAGKLRDEAIWQQLQHITIQEAIGQWLQTFSKLTAKAYREGMNVLAEARLIDFEMTLQQFALINHNAVIDDIKKKLNKTECTKQARAACYISFTRYLSRRTQGMIVRAIPCREGTDKTFFKVREKVKTNAMNHKQWTQFLKELDSINKRDCLIAKLIIQGGKRLSEVLTLTTDQIDFSTREIIYNQAKTKGFEKQTVITYPQGAIEALRAYLKGREGLVFVTRRGKNVLPNQLAITFCRAGESAKIPFKVTPHVLRASTVTYLKKEGFADSEIMKVTGHASAEQVHAYDKSERSDNPTKEINLV